MRHVVLTSPAVRAAIETEAQLKSGKAKASKPGSRPAPSSLEAAEQRAKHIVEQMFADQQLPVLSGLGYGFRKIWRRYMPASHFVKWNSLISYVFYVHLLYAIRLYQNIVVDEAGIAAVREAAAKGPVIFIPTHRSYVDFLIVSYMCLATQLPLPYIAAGYD
jgi:glycerol-3-phosphate O-acyltransferase